MKARIAVLMALSVVCVAFALAGLVYVRSRRGVMEDLRRHLVREADRVAKRIEILWPAASERDVAVWRNEAARILGAQRVPPHLQPLFVYLALQDESGRIVLVLDPLREDVDVTLMAPAVAALYHVPDEGRILARHPRAERDLNEDGRADYLSAYAPAVAAHGTRIGIVGVDMPRSVVAAEERKALHQPLTILLWGAALAGVLGLIAGRYAGRAIDAAAERRYRAIAETIPDVILRLDRNKRLVYANPAAAGFVGSVAEPRTGIACDSLGLPDPIDGTWRDRLDDILKNGVPLVAECLVEGADGTRVFDLHFTPEREAKGCVTGVIVVGRDITARTRSEQMLEETNEKLQETIGELKETQQKLIQQERLGALGSMARGVAHDINNSLQPILLAAGILEQNLQLLEDPAVARKYLSDILQAAREASGTVQRLVRFYRPSAEHRLETFDLGEVVRSVVDLTRPRWRDEALAKGKTVDLAADVTGSCPIEGFRDEVREAVVNLVFNAEEALGETGRIVARARVDGDDAILEVEDNGSGMTEEVRQRCLEPFFTTRKKRGSGLGLSIVYGIVERHKGGIRIESEPGRGTLIAIRFPIARNAVSQTLQSVSPPPSQHRQRGGLPSAKDSLRILVVDDDGSLRQLLVYALSAAGHRVTDVASGDEGWRVFQQGPFDAVITDQAMPGMTGDQLARHIKRCAPSMPVILLTGFADVMRAQGNIPVDVDSVLSKPVLVDELLFAVSQTVSGMWEYRDSLGDAANIDRRTVRVLAAEDEESSRLLMAQILSRLGYEFGLVETGREAIDKLSKEDYDVVLMDLRMPEMDGFEATHVIRDPESPVRNHHIPIIAVTAHGTSEQCFDTGMNGFIAKPLDRKEIDILIRKSVAAARRSRGQTPEAVG